MFQNRSVATEVQLYKPVATSHEILHRNSIRSPSRVFNPMARLEYQSTGVFLTRIVSPSHGVGKPPNFFYNRRPPHISPSWRRRCTKVAVFYNEAPLFLTNTTDDRCMYIYFFPAATVVGTETYRYIMIAKQLYI